MAKDLKKVKLSKDEIDEAKLIFDTFWKEDQDVRIQSLAKWRKLKLLWNNIQNTWYDAVAHDWRIWNGESLNDSDGSQAYYDNRINVFRAYLEAIIAALSITVPPVKCYPDDAENSADIETAKAGDKIAELIYRHNDVPLLWLHGLYVYMTEGFVVARATDDYSKNYGTNKVDDYEENVEVHDITTCPNCGFELDNQIVDPSQINNEPIPPVEPPPIDPLAQQPQEELDLAGLDMPPDPNMMPPEMMGDMGMDDMGMGMDMGMGQMQDICPSCQTPMTPQVERVNEIKLVLVGTTQEPKGRIKLGAYGGLNIKIPLYARTQDECFYLYYAYECHYAQAISKYPDLHEELHSATRGASNGPDSWEQWARLNVEYRTGSYPIDNVTDKTGWFKPEAYNILEHDRAKHWKRKFPDGIALTFINEVFACARVEELDKHWTLQINPLADFLQNDPVSMLLVSVQEITNDIVSLTKQTIEHGVGLTFIDPAFIDLNAYGQTEVLPGSMIPTKTISGNRKLADGIYEVKTATLSQEVLPFSQQVQTLGQTVIGAPPSLWGGQIEGSETASEYSMSKNQAQSKLGNVWKMFGIWWKNHFGKAIPLYIGLVQTDERDVKRRKDGSFVNVLIRKAELNGKIGKVELEANENIPLTWSQRKDVIMQLLLSPNPQVIQMLMAPENLDVLREAIGIDGFYVIGEDDRDKQYNEIQRLLEAEPITTGEIDPMTMAPTEMPSVEVDEIMDNHIIQFEICRKWAVSEAGQLAKIENEPGYKNVLLHAKQHLMVLNAGTGAAAPADSQGNGAEPVEKPNELAGKEAPITGMSDVQTIQ